MIKIDLDLISNTFANVEFFLTCFGSTSKSIFHSKKPDFLEVVTGEKFWAVTSKVPTTGRSLINQVDGASILFRGYDSNMSVHSYSSNAELEKLASPDLLTNGVFSYIKFDQHSQQTIVRSDAFGISPLFYRRVDGMWLFASHPSLLHFLDDEIDHCSWLSMLQSGLMIAGQSFYRDITRFPAGVQMSISESSVITENWFKFEQLPQGDRLIDDNAFTIVEQSYLRAMNRCLSLNMDSITLPLSSGFDSRRFLATLVKKKSISTRLRANHFMVKTGNIMTLTLFLRPKSLLLSVLIVK